MLLTVKKSNGSITAPTDVKVSFTDGTCTDTWALTPSSNGTQVATTSTYYFGVPFAASTTTGSGASASGQTGTLTVCADLKSGSNYFKATSAAFTSSFTATTPLTVSLPSSTVTSGC
jgi:hypothetical protein